MQKFPPIKCPKSPALSYTGGFGWGNLDELHKSEKIASGQGPDAASEVVDDG